MWDACLLETRRQRGALHTHTLKEGRKEVDEMRASASACTCVGVVGRGRRGAERREPGRMNTRYAQRASARTRGCADCTQ